MRHFLAQEITIVACTTMCQNSISKWLWEEKFETKKFLLTKKEFLSVVQYIINLFTALSYLSRHYDFKIFMIQKYVLTYSFIISTYFHFVLMLFAFVYY